MMVDSSPPGLPGQVRRLATAGLAAAALFGAGVRGAFLDDKPFWRDEAWVAWVVELPPPARASVLHVSPPGFLAAVRVTARLLPGAPEVAYRAVPFAAGLAAMVLLPLLARRLGASSAAVVATAWIGAGAPALVYYSRELKPYGLDLLWAILLLLAAARGAADRPGSVPWRRWALVTLLAVLAPWFGYGSVFTAAAAMAWIGWEGLRGAGDRARPLAVLALGAAFVTTLAAAYLVVLRAQIAHPLLPRMWDDALPPGPTGAGHLVRAASDVVRLPLPYLFPGAWVVAALLAVVGLAVLAPASRRLLLWFLLAPAGLAAACAAARLYVVAHGRFLLFLAPALMVAVGAGLAWSGQAALKRAGPRAGPAAAVGLAAAWAVGWGVVSVQRRLRPPEPRPRPFVFDVIQDVEPLITWLEGEGVTPDRVLVGRHAGDAFRYYARGRLAGARVMGFDGHGYGAEFAGWLEGRSEGMVLLVAEEAGSYRRTLEARSFSIATAAAARGAAVWRLTRASPPRTPPGSRGAAAAPSGPGR